MKLSKNGRNYYEVGADHLLSDQVIKLAGGYRLSKERKEHRPGWWPFWSSDGRGLPSGAWTKEHWDAKAIADEKAREKNRLASARAKKKRGDRVAAIDAKLSYLESIGITARDAKSTMNYDDLLKMLTSIEKTMKELLSIKAKVIELVTLGRHGAEPDEIIDWIHYHLSEIDD